jgi:hypothetical protein
MERQEREDTADEGRNEDEPAEDVLAEEESTEESTGEREGGEGRPRRRRRRRRRPSDRGPRPERAGEEPMTESEADEAFPSESPLGISAADDDEEEGVDAEGDLESEEGAPRVYRNVPTWEEAISYLLHRHPTESRPREGERSREHRRDGGRRSDRGDRGGERGGDRGGERSHD